MRRNSFLVVFLMTFGLLAGSSINLRAQTKSATEKEKAPLRVALAGLVHGHASGFFDQFQHREDLQVVEIAEADRRLAEQLAKTYGLAPGPVYSDLEEIRTTTQP